MKIVQLRNLAEVWTSSVDKHTVEGEIPVQLCNYTDAYKNDRVRPGVDLMRATATPAEIGRNRLAKGDTVFTKDSEDPADIGISAFVDGEADDFVCGYHLAIARPHEGVHPRFLNWALRSRPVLEHFGNHATGISRYGIGLQGLRSAPIADVGDSDDQRRIADFLDDRVSRIDRIIAARREQTTCLVEQAYSSMQEVLLGGADISLLSAEPWYYDPAGRLHLRALRSIWSVIDCKHRTPTYVDHGYPVVSPGDISPGRLNLAGADRFVGESVFLDLADDSRRCRRGDIVYSRNASAGIASYVDTSELFTMGQDVCRITSASQDQLYLMYCLNYLVAPQLESYSVGSTFTRINIDQIKALVVPVPDLSIQRRLSTRSDELAEQFARMKSDLGQSIELLAEYKSSLITAAVTGELDVTTAGSTIPE